MVNPLDLNQWEFHVLSAKKLDNMLPNQKTVSLVGIQKIGAIKTDYSGLYQAIHSEFATV